MDIKVLLHEALDGYTGKALNGYSVLTQDEAAQVYTVVSIGILPDKRLVEVGLIVRLAGEQIIIERDVNNKPLVESLVQLGVPRHHITLAYTGEAIPEMP